MVMVSGGGINNESMAVDVVSGGDRGILAGIPSIICAAVLCLKWQTGATGSIGRRTVHWTAGKGENRKKF